jgi:membrane-associated protease RseP (regulator of RpoE activity)
MDGKLIMGLALALLSAGAVQAKPAPAPQTDAATEEAIEQRMRELSRELRELERKLGKERRVQVIEDRMVAMNRAMLGINVDDEASTKSGEGVVVAAVTPNGPAGKAGLKSGDLILSIDGKPLKAKGDDTPFAQLREVMADKDPGSEAKLKVKREGKNLDLSVKTEAYAPRAFAFRSPGRDGTRFEMLVPPMAPMAPLPPNAPMPSLAPLMDLAPGMARFRYFAREWGDLEMVSLSPKLGEYFGAKEGVLVVHAPDAKSLPLQDGDVILRIGDRKPSNPEQVMRILRSYDGGEKLKLEVLRNRKAVTLDLEVPTRSGGGAWSEDGGEVIDLLAPSRDG